jgi:prophage tail gpP-like protein
MADELEPHLVVNGADYAGWKAVSVTRSMESIAGSFQLEVSDRWAARAESWPIREEDSCLVQIDGETVIDGFVDVRSPALAAQQVNLAYSGKDRSSSLVECSGIVTGADSSKNKWVYRNVSVLEFCQAIAKPFGVPVSLQPGLTLAKLPQLVAHPGDDAFEMMSKAANDDGVLLVSDGHGGVVITRRGTTSATALVQGVNVMGAAGSFDMTDRFYRYLIASQVPGTEDESGEQANVIAEAFDLDVRRRNRVKLIRPEKNYNRADAKRRADWESRVRAAKSARFQVTVQGWRQTSSNELWPINALVPVEIPRIGLHGEMLISQAQYTVAESGRVTVLQLVRPDAFEPEPKAFTKGEGGWKELRKGAF